MFILIQIFGIVFVFCVMFLFFVKWRFKVSQFCAERRIHPLLWEDRKSLFFVFSFLVWMSLIPIAMFVPYINTMKQNEEVEHAWALLLVMIGCLIIIYLFFAHHHRQYYRNNRIN